MLPPAEYGNEYRDPHSDITKRVRDIVTLSPNVSIKFPPFRELQRIGGKECKSQRRWRTHKHQKQTNKQSPLKQHKQSSYELTDTEAACTGTAGVLHQALCTFMMVSSLLFFMGFLSAQLRGPLIIVPALGLFSFCRSVFDVVVFVLAYILFCRISKNRGNECMNEWMNINFATRVQVNNGTVILYLLAHRKPVSSNGMKTAPGRISCQE